MTRINQADQAETELEGSRPGEAYLISEHRVEEPVLHPVSGKMFHPSVITIFDHATHLAVGWSAGQEKWTADVLDAFRHAVLGGNVPFCCYLLEFWPAVIGQHGPHDGELGRLLLSLGVYALPIGSDEEAMLNQVRKDEETLWSRKADAPPPPREGLPWGGFLSWCKDRVAVFNHRPHPKLQQFTDPATGKKRPPTPTEAFERAAVERVPVLSVSYRERDALCAFHQQLVAPREEFKNPATFETSLNHVRGDGIAVGYGLEDAGDAWLRRMAGHLLCEPKIMSGLEGFIPETESQQRTTRRFRASMRNYHRTIPQRSGKPNRRKEK
jgi:putative transposase